MQIRLLEKSTVAAAAIAASLMLGSAASATVVPFENGPDGGGTQRFTVTCEISCQGYLFDDETFGTVGGLIDFKDQNFASGQGAAWEKDLLEKASGETFSDFSKDENPSTTFTSNAMYILFKIGNSPSIGVLKNNSGFLQEYTYSKSPNGHGLSHIAEAGKGLPEMPPAAVIPLPAAGWLLLAGIGGLAAMRRRKSV